MAFEIRFDMHEKGSDHISSTSALDYGMISDFQTLLSQFDLMNSSQNTIIQAFGDFMHISYWNIV